MRDINALALSPVVNEPLPLPRLRSPSIDYDVVAIVDVSTSGIGAIIQIAGYDRVISLAPEAVPWHAFFAHVEPTAIARLFVAAHVVGPYLSNVVE
jgi:hypothetical protein